MGFLGGSVVKNPPANCNLVTKQQQLYPMCSVAQSWPTLCDPMLLRHHLYPRSLTGQLDEGRLRRAATALCSCSVLLLLRVWSAFPTSVRIQPLTLNSYSVPLSQLLNLYK